MELQELMSRLGEGRILVIQIRDPKIIPFSEAAAANTSYRVYERDTSAEQPHREERQPS